MTVSKKAEHVLVKILPAGPKTAKQNEEDIAQSKQRYELTSPYRVLCATPEAVTVEING